MRRLLSARAAALTLVSAPQMLAAQTADPAFNIQQPPATESQSTALALSAEQRAAVASWPAERRKTYDLWPAPMKGYYWTLTARQQRGWWRMTDEQRAMIHALTPEQKIGAWQIIESRMAAGAAGSARDASTGASSSPPIGQPAR